MSFGFVTPWHAFLPREPGHVVGFMGSGGKTTLMRTVADVYHEAGSATVLTTTTRSEVLPGIPAVTWDALQAEPVGALPDRIYVHGGVDAAGKWRGLSVAQVDRLGGLLPARVVLCEVDGAAKKALKLYRDGEPVWPRRTSLALVVMGVGAVGGRAGDHVHRWGRIAFPALAGSAAHTVLEWEHVSQLLLAPGGYLDQVPPGVPAALALCGLAEQDDSIGLFGFVGQAMEDPNLPLVLFCAQGEARLAIRTACVEREQDMP